MKIEADLFDGKSSQKTPVKLIFSQNGIDISVDEIQKHYDYYEVEISSRVGNTPRKIVFPDGLIANSLENDKIDAALKAFQNKKEFAHIFESKGSLVLISFISIILVALFFITNGSDMAAKAIADVTPLSIEKKISSSVLKTLDEHLLRESNLTQAQKEEILKVFQRVTKNDPKYHLHFRQGIGENAFALPGGDIVITDEIINFSKGDDEMIYGILAHEMGHVEHKHSLKMIIKASAISIVIGYLTGDVSVLTTYAASLLTSGYSRDFEREADDFAKQRMKADHISPTHLVKFFKEIEKKYGKGGDNNFFATHPSNEERIQNLLN